MLLKIVYLLTCRALGLAALVFRGDRAKDAELLVLRHENAVLRRVGAENPVTLCHLGIFVDQAAEPVPPQNTRAGHFHRRMRAPRGRVLVQCPVRPVAVIVTGILTKDQAQMPFADDQHPVQALAAGTADPAFRDRVRTRRPYRGLDDPHAGRGEYRVERRGELGVPVTDQEFEAVSVALEVHQQVTGLLGHPLTRRVGSDPGQVHRASTRHIALIPSRTGR